MSEADLLRVVQGPSTGRTATIAGRIVIGRSDVDLRIDDPAVSRLHAVVEAGEGDAVTVADAGSSRGTRLDGAAVTDAVPLGIGASIEVGKSRVRRLRVVRYPDDDAPEVRVLGPDTDRVVAVDRELTVGRDEDADIRLDDDTVSRVHLRLSRSGRTVTVSDAGSRAGVAVNGRRIQDPEQLRTGDEITLPGSGWTLRVEADDVAGPAYEFRIRAEASEREQAVRVDAESAATVADVARRLAEQLGDVADRPWTLYRDSDGLVFDRAQPWRNVRIGRGDLVVLADLETPAGAPPPTAESRARTVSRSPGAADLPAPVRLEAPRAPEAASLRGRGIGWQLGGGALGVVGGLVIAIALQNWVFALIGGIAGVGGLVFGILADQSRRRHQVGSHRGRLDDLVRRAGEAEDAQRRALERRTPPTDRWRDLIEGRQPPLWERRPADPDFLRLTLGRGTRASVAEIVVPDGEGAPGIGEPRTVSDVPVQGPAGGVFGVVGSRPAVEALATHALVEASILHPPHVLAIHVAVESDQAAVATWLPHAADGIRSRVVRDERDLGDLVQALAESGPAALVVIDDVFARRLGGLLADWRPERGLVVVLAPDASALPREATAWVEVGSGTARVVGTYPDAPLGAFVPVSLGHDAAVDLSLAESGLVDPHTAVRTRLAAGHVLDLGGIRVGGEIRVGESWRVREPGRLEAVIGTLPDGSPAEFDLRRDGPHAVVAGTTGSGKSELLASLLASLVGRYGPESLTLFLIDYKGGATFARFAEAPHVVGIVTDLEADDSLARRAFTALEAEIARRKRLLSEARVSDIAAYSRVPGAAALPSLVVVIDEFALLVQTQPEVKARLDAVAAQGRSLGIHLVLATQSPAGVVTPAIRANTNLWISLRVVSETESREVIGAPDAARLPVDAPGRAIARRGGESRLTEFQTGRVTVVTGSAGRAVSVRAFGPAATSVTAPVSSPDPAPTPGPDDLRLLVDEVRAEVARGRHAVPPELWLPPLGERISADEFPDDAVSDGLSVSLGIADLVGAQRQVTHAVDLTASGLLVTGAPRSGRTNVLRQVAADLAETRAPQRVHVYAIHADGGLADLERLPHVAAVVQLDDTERLVRLLGRLSGIIEARRAGTPDPAAERIVLLVDDYPAVKDATESRFAGRLHDQLLSIAATGRGAGVHVVLATLQPADLRLGTIAGFGSRLMLRAVDRTDYQAIEWRPAADELPPRLPGRAIVADGVEVQVVLADLDRAARLADGWPVGPLPRAVERLPLVVQLADLAPIDPRRGLPLGLGGADLETVVVDASAGAHLVVLGESRSGRSTALLTLARAHLATPGARVAAFVPRASPLQVLRDGTSTAFYADGPAQVEELLAAVDRDPSGLLVMIDDSDHWPQASGDALDRLLRRSRDLGVRFAVAARSGDWVRSFEAWSRYLMSLKTALLLSDFTELGPSLDVRLEPPAMPAAPGRGYLVARGRAQVVQVALTAE